MSQESRFPDERVDALVRSYLEDAGRDVDARALLRGIERRLSSSTQEVERAAARRGFLSRRRVRWALSLAASLLVVTLVSYFVLVPRTTSASAVVSAAREAIAADGDRCYLVEVEAPRIWFRRHPILSSIMFCGRFPGESTPGAAGDAPDAFAPRRVVAARFWTRGDRFRMAGEAPDRDFTWGQDENGRVWFASADNRGLAYRRGEEPPMIGAVRSMLSLDVMRLSKRFVNSVDFKFAPPSPDDDPAMIVIQATAKPGRENLQRNTARITIERKTNLVKRLELSRPSEGFTVTCRLAAVEHQPEASYRLEGNLAADPTIFTREQAEEREQVYRELTNPHLDVKAR